MYGGLRQLQVQSLPFLGKWSYCFPFAFFVGFVGIEVLALKASGHWTSVRTDLVVSCAGLVTIIGILAAFFASLFNRLEGLFHQISLIHLMEREEVEDLEDNHNQLLDALKQQGDFCKRMSHYYPLVLLVVFIMAELVFLTAAGYMEAIEDKLAPFRREHGILNGADGGIRLPRTRGTSAMAKGCAEHRFNEPGRILPELHGKVVSCWCEGSWSANAIRGGLRAGLW